MAEQLRQEILNGVYRPGKRLPGEPVLANRFGVGRVTVAKAMQILQQSNLVFRVRGSGTYVQHDVAKGVVRWAIGYAVTDRQPLQNTPTAISLEAAHQYLEERGHCLRVLTRGDLVADTMPAAEIRRMVRAGAINGLIIGYSMAPERIKSIGQILPTVCVASDQLHDGTLCGAVDYTLGYFLATRHLLDLGHRRIGLLGARAAGSIGYRARQAFRLALQLAGVDPQDCPMSQHGFYPDRHSERAEDMLAKNPDMTGVVCADDTVALAVIGVARRRGLRVPEDFSVVGCNDLPDAATCDPPLTTLRIDFAMMGRLAAEILLARMFGKEMPAWRYIKPELIIRRSTGPAAG